MDRSVPAVYPALGKLQKLIAADGIPKDQKTSGSQSYKYRGTEAVMNKLVDALIASDLVIIPTRARESHEQITVDTRNGPQQQLLCCAEVGYVIYSTIDGSSVPMSSIGYGIGNQATVSGIALSYAYRGAIEKALCIPTEGDPELGPEIAQRPKQINPENERKTQPPPPPAVTMMKQVLDGVADAPEDKLPLVDPKDIPKWKPDFCFPANWRPERYGAKPMHEADSVVLAQFIDEMEGKGKALRKRVRQMKEFGGTKLDDLETAQRQLVAVKAAFARGVSLAEKRLEDEHAKLEKAAGGQSYAADPTT